MRTSIRLAIAAVLLIALIALASFKPARRLFPTAYGLTCGTGPVCAESPEALPRAEQLYRDALRFVDERVEPLKKPRPFLFCSTTRCAEYFGAPVAKGETTGPFGSVVAPDGWLPYVVRHELIHQIQNEQLGMYRLHPGPRWFLEGMAYTLSEDPRADLGEPWQHDREEFRRWYAGLPRPELWERARQLR